MAFGVRQELRSGGSARVHVEGPPKSRIRRPFRSAGGLEVSTTSPFGQETVRTKFWSRFSFARDCETGVNYAPPILQLGGLGQGGNAMKSSFLSLKPGLSGSDAMSTARVALVPQNGDVERPAWPQALDALRRLQLPDGGWGEGHVYNAYDRFGCTLTALRTLQEWECSEDVERIERGRAILDVYARDLGREDRDPVGFEFIIDRLLQDLRDLGAPIAVELPDTLAATRAQRLAHLGTLSVDPSRPRSWWFSMECLPEATLAKLDPSMVNEEAGLVTSTGATAAYLRAVRLAGGDNIAAASYLDKIVKEGGGGVGFSRPLDTFQTIWSVDAFLKVGVSANDPLIRPSIEELRRLWGARRGAISFSPYFPVADGDDIVVAYSVLRQAGYDLIEDPFKGYWNGRLMESYPGERTSSISVNIHALQALKDSGWRGKVYEDMAEPILRWLRPWLTSDAPLVDPWHVSPVYLLSHGICTLKHFDQSMADRCVERLLNSQEPDGGWGGAGVCTEEETALGTIGLLDAYRGGMLKDSEPLRKAGVFLARNRSESGARPRLWLAKSLYLPVNMVEAFIEAARIGLHIAGLSDRQ